MKGAGAGTGQDTQHLHGKAAIEEIKIFPRGVDQGRMVRCLTASRSTGSQDPHCCQPPLCPTRQGHLCPSSAWLCIGKKLEKQAVLLLWADSCHELINCSSSGCGDLPSTLSLTQRSSPTQLCFQEKSG